jgi:hypothetical protein
MSNLSDQINFLANGLVEGILAAVRETSVSDVVAEDVRYALSGVSRKLDGVPVRHLSTKVGSGRLPRRSPEDLEKVVGLVVGALGKAKTGLRSEQLQAALQLSKKEIVGPLNLALSEKKIVKKGQKRATTYFVATRAKVVKKVPVKKAKSVAVAKKKSGVKKMLAKKSLKSAKGSKRK